MISRRLLPFLAIAPALLALSITSSSLLVRWNGDEIGVSAPQFHFLTGKALDRLRDGATVAFDAQLSLLASARPAPLERAVDRFVVSYDVWDEKFSVTRWRTPRSSISHLSAFGVEAWCLESMRLAPPSGTAEDELRLRLELRAEDPRELNPLSSEPGISLSGLIELFSRPARYQQQKWLLESAPFRFRDFKR